jgi:hypothetical protein
MHQAKLQRRQAAMRQSNAELRKLQSAVRRDPFEGLEDLLYRIDDFVKLRIHPGRVTLPLPSGAGRPTRVYWSPGFLEKRTSKYAKPYTALGLAKYLGEVESAGGGYVKPSERFKAAFALLQRDQITGEHESERLADIVKSGSIRQALRLATGRRRNGWHNRRIQN